MFIYASLRQGGKLLANCISFCRKEILEGVGAKKVLNSLFLTLLFNVCNKHILFCKLSKLLLPFKQIYKVTKIKYNIYMNIYMYVIYIYVK